MPSFFKSKNTINFTKIIISLLSTTAILFVLGLSYTKADSNNIPINLGELSSDNHNNTNKINLPQENSILQPDFQLKLLDKSTNGSFEFNNLCNFGYTECQYKRMKVILSDIPDLAIRKEYLKEISLNGNYLSPIIYNIIHKDKNIANEGLFNNINILDDSSSDLAYTKLKFQELLDSKYNLETGIYLGKVDFTYVDISGVLTHELTHYLKIPQESAIFNELTWIEEGVSDYVYNKLGYSSVGNNHYPHCEPNQSYQHGYMCAADFFIFIENKYQKNIPKEYVYMLENGIALDSYDNFVETLFSKFVGKNLDTLWNEYLKSK